MTTTQLRFFFLCLIFLPTIGFGQIYTVVNTNDSGPGSLRVGVETATPGTTIYFDAGIAGQTITLASELAPTASITIDGQDKDITISGGGSTRIFNVNGTYDFYIFNITLTQGNASVGGAIYALNGALITAENVHFIDNNAWNDGGAIRQQSGSHSFKNCSFVGNSASFFAGAYYQLFGTVSFENVLFSGNKANGSGGAMYLRGTSAFTGCTVTGNFANTGNGGAMFMYVNANVTIQNSIYWENLVNGFGNVSVESFYEIDNGASVNLDISYSIIQGSGGSGAWNPLFGVDGGNNLDVDPEFALPIAPTSAPTTTGNFRPVMLSPANNSGGNALSTTANDLDGHNRIHLGIIDRGPFEFCTTYDTLTPIACNSYSSPGGNTYNASGTYYDTLSNTLGCDSVVVIYLTLNNNTFNTINPVECNSYVVPSASYTITTTGTYMDTIPNTAGCDSIITINATINNESFSTLTESSCNSYTSPSGNYTWTVSGVYQDTIPNIAGCDSVMTINLTVIYESFSTLTETACGSYTSPSGNNVWTASGSYQDTIPNWVGCDSIITIGLTILNNSASTINPVECVSYTSPSGNNTWTQSGTYTDIIPNSVGCDSVITVNLTIPNPETYIDIIACSEYTSPSGLYTWTASGSYLDTLTNILGCDSLIYINLDVTDANDFINVAGSQLTTDFGGGTVEWMWCDTAQVMSTANSYTPDFPGDYALIVDNGTCIDTSDCVPVDKDYSQLTGFSPNGDGVNDILRLDVHDANNTVTIFNRWGDEIIQIQGYNNVDIVWDGTDSSGKVTSGTYYYVIQESGTNKVGWIQLLK